jgi:2-dehydro-3-deoxygluconokinase
MGFLDGVRMFHTSGITPALSERAATAVSQGLHTARSRGIVTSYDLNYRSKLWSSERARATQAPLMECVDVLFTTEEDARTVFGFRGDDLAVARQMVEALGCRVVTVTLRGDRSVLQNSWTAIAWDGDQEYRDRSYDIEIVDRVGGGDAYAAGFIYGYLTEGVGTAVGIGNAMSALKQTSVGDFSWVTRDEVAAVIRGAGLRIQR